MIFVGLGANLPSRYGAPEQTLEAAKEALEAAGFCLMASSSIWRSAPVPASDDPWYCNAVVAVKANQSPQEALQALHAIEKDFGRERSVRNAPRLLDLDLLAFDNEVSDGPDFILPHPRMHERGFVLLPLREIAPAWVHPVINRTIDELIADLPEGQALEPIKKDAA